MHQKIWLVHEAHVLCQTLISLYRCTAHARLHQNHFGASMYMNDMVGWCHIRFGYCTPYNHQRFSQRQDKARDQVAVISFRHMPRMSHSIVTTSNSIGQPVWWVGMGSFGLYMCISLKTCKQILSRWDSCQTCFRNTFQLTQTRDQHHFPPRCNWSSRSRSKMEANWFGVPGDKVNQQPINRISIYRLLMLQFFLLPRFLRDQIATIKAWQRPNVKCLSPEISHGLDPAMPSKIKIHPGSICSMPWKWTRFLCGY